MAGKSITRRKGGGVQVRASSSRWTAANRELFLAKLAETLNVTATCRVVGLCDRGAYKLRQRDPGFAAAWEQTVADAYARVEMLLLERALGGAPEGTAAATGDTRHLETLSERALLTLLNQHRQTVRDVRSVAERAAERSAGRTALDEEMGAGQELMAKLDEIAARLDAAERSRDPAGEGGGDGA
jgi:hypothetical protein